MKKSASLLANRNFTYYFLGSLFGVLGEGIYGLTAIVLVLENTNSIIEISRMLTLTLLPSVFLAPFIGVFIDSFNKRKLMVFCNLLRFLSIAVIPLSHQLGFHQDFFFFLSIFTSYIIWYILEPAKESMLKKILSKEQYGQGIAVVQGAWQVGLLSSAIIAGFIMDQFGDISAVLVSSFTYILAASFFMMMSFQDSRTILKHSNSIITNFTNEMKSGWLYILKTKVLFYFVINCSLILPFFYSINTLIVPFNFEVLNGTSVSLGLIDSGAGIGSFISAFLCIYLARSPKLNTIIVTSILLAAGSIIFFSYSSHITSAFLLYMALGTFIGNVKVLTRLIVYKNVEFNYIGRVMTTISLLSLLLSIMMTLITAFIAERSIGSAYLSITILLLFGLVCTLLGAKAEVQNRVTAEFKRLTTR